MKVSDRDTRQDPADAEQFGHEVRVLRERLAFYEGFDRLIQENVADARELFRVAAQERASASRSSEHAEQEQTARERLLLAELAEIAKEFAALSMGFEVLSRRVASLIAEAGRFGISTSRPEQSGEHSVSVVAHGVESARAGRLLRDYVAALPQVAAVSTREYADGLLRLDARVRDALSAEHFREWDPKRAMTVLTERAGVIEVALGGGSE